MLEDFLRELFEINKIKVTDVQFNEMAEDIQGYFDMINEMESYQHAGPSPVEEENKQLKKELEKEKNKQVCPNCQGTGRNIINGPYHSAESSCFKCSGSGKIDP